MHLVKLAEVNNVASFTFKKTFFAEIQQNTQQKRRWIKMKKNEKKKNLLAITASFHNTLG